MKVPEPRKLKSGNWHVRLILDGEPVYITRPTARECKREAEILKAEYRANLRRNSSKESMTLREAMQAYVDSMETLSPSTIRGYTSIINNRLQGVIDTPIRAIDDWQKVINDECKRLSPTTQKPVSPKTVANVWGLVASALAYQKFPVPKVTLPKVPENDLPWIEPEQLHAFVDACNGHKYEIGMLLALHGLRRSEIMALTWDKINLEKGTIKVSGAMVYDKDNKLVEKKTNKTKSSTRTIRIMIPQLSEAMKAVEDKSGKVVQCYPNTLYKNINRVCDKLEYEGVGCHGLRRSFASLGHSLKWSEENLMQAGGWKDRATMHNFYVKLSQAERDRDTNAMEDFYSSKKQKSDKKSDNL